MMGPNMGVNHQNRPEANERKGVAVERSAAHDGNNVISQGYGQGGEEEAQNVMSIEPAEDRVRHAAERAGFRIPNRIAEKIAEEGKDDSAEYIPDGDVKKVFLALFG